MPQPIATELALQIWEAVAAHGATGWSATWRAIRSSLGKSNGLCAARAQPYRGYQGSSASTI